MLDQRVGLSAYIDNGCIVGDLDAVVAVPVCNERERIENCLQALARQSGSCASSFGILLFLNNCDDNSAAVVEAAMAELPCPVRMLDVADARANAGWARREAMNAAAAWLRDSGCADGVILTTDADSCVPNDWVARNLGHIAAGADAVAGRIALDATDAALLPASLHARGRLEARYEAILTEIGARLDPEPANPWPCHWTKSGATLAVRRSAYEAIGGLPALAHGEDRAFVDALRAADFVVRHAVDIEVVTSGRLEGRAPGGAADTMRLRCEFPDHPCDDRLESLARAVGRVALRRYLRRLYEQDLLGRTWLWAPLLAIAAEPAARLAVTSGYVRAHAAIEAASPRLAYRPQRPSQLPRQIRFGSLLLRVLRALARAERPADSRACAPVGIDPRTEPTLP